MADRRPLLAEWLRAQQHRWAFHRLREQVHNPGMRKKPAKGAAAQAQVPATAATAAFVEEPPPQEAEVQQHEQQQGGRESEALHPV